MIDSLLADAKKELVPDHRTVVYEVHGKVMGKDLTLAGEIHTPQLKEQLLRYIREHSQFAVIDSLSVLPQRVLGDRVFGVVSLSVANIRTKPDHAAEMGTQAILGTPVKILRKQGAWYNVQTPDDYLGWTDDNVVRMNGDEYGTWAGRPKVIVTTEYGWVRESANPAAQPVSDVVIGCLLGLKKGTGTHFEVEFPDGRSGFLSKTDARPFGQWLSKAKDTPETIVAMAKRFFGVPYLWGGTSAKGMDCSGFTKTVYFMNGVLLPRDARQQACVGDPIELPPGEVDLKAGDLLFFGSRATAEKAERVTHVAISLGGKRFIHASGQVKMNSLNQADSDYSDFRAESFLRARRIIGAGESSGVRRLVTIPYYRSNEHR